MNSSTEFRLFKTAIWGIIASGSNQREKAQEKSQTELRSSKQYVIAVKKITKELNNIEGKSLLCVDRS